jgi:hypothetical protein
MKRNVKKKILYYIHLFGAIIYSLSFFIGGEKKVDRIQESGRIVNMLKKQLGFD